MGLKVKSGWDDLFDRFKKLPKKVRRKGREWSKECAIKHQQLAIEQLRIQGRGGQGPPLSAATKIIYQQTGWPDGSNLENHIRVRKKDKFARCEIEHGRPSLVARVQNNGAVIPVTPRMRGYLHYLGIHLRSDTTHIHVPARFFWDIASQKAKEYAAAKLRSLEK